MRWVVGGWFLILGSTGVAHAIFGIRNPGWSETGWWARNRVVAWLLTGMVSPTKARGTVSERLARERFGVVLELIVSALFLIGGAATLILGLHQSA
jgi:hypothetical protein